MSALLEHAQTLMLSALRCDGCGRAPTVDEVTAMREDFGGKLRADDGPRLVWRCLPCARKASPS